jgi:hypothetical protein
MAMPFIHPYQLHCISAVITKAGRSQQSHMLPMVTHSFAVLTRNHCLQHPHDSSECVMIKAMCWLTHMCSYPAGKSFRTTH